MNIYHNSVRAVAAATEQKEKRIEEMVNRGDAMIRPALVKALCRLKGGDSRKPYPEPRQIFSDTLRADRVPNRPFHKAFDLLARMIEDGLSHHDARVFAAQMVAFVDSIYAEREKLEPLAVLAPRLVKESAEATAAQMAALCHPCQANHDYALDETREAANLTSITLQTLEAEAARKYRPISAAR